MNIQEQKFSDNELFAMRVRDSSNRDADKLCELMTYIKGYSDAGGKLWIADAHKDLIGALCAGAIALRTQGRNACSDKLFHAQWVL